MMNGCITMGSGFFYKGHFCDYNSKLSHYNAELRNNNGELGDCNAELMHYNDGWNFLQWQFVGQ